MKRDGFAGFLRDNLEAFAVAIAMALVIRHYCIEAFRIPTKSMMPTLLGDDALSGQHGDRILVDKFVYLRREPERWEVVVFQYPLNRSRNFIKRLVGLPGEHVRLVDGDIWASPDGGETWAIQRKPPGVQEQLFFPYYPEPIEKPHGFQGSESWDRGPGWEASERARRFVVDAEGLSALRFLPEVTPYGEGGWSGRPYCGDVRVRFDLAVKRAGTLTVRITEHGRPHRLVLGPDGSRAVVSRGEQEHHIPLDLRLREGMELSVSFANVDDTLLVSVSGDAGVDATIEFPDPPSEPPDPSLFGDGVEWAHAIALEADGLAATLTDLAIDRDLYYDASEPDPGRTWEVPDDHFFMLGDNTRSSKDSRLWKVSRARLLDGTEILWEPGSESDVPGQPLARHATGDDDDLIRVEADVDGLVRTFRNGDVDTFDHNLRRPYVSRDHLVGRAFAIFWPIHVPPAYRGPTRVSLIR